MEAAPNTAGFVDQIAGPRGDDVACSTSLAIDNQYICSNGLLLSITYAKAAGSTETHGNQTTATLNMCDDACTNLLNDNNLACLF